MRRTALITTIVVITLGIYDLATVAFTGVGSSVSQFLVDSGFKAPVMVFAFGFVCGHLFGYMSPSKGDK